MISSKRFESVDGATTRFLSDFIIQSEQHCRVYLYKYNASCALDSSCNTIVGGVYIRELDAPQSADLVTVDKWDLVDNSIVFYITPTAGVTIVIEVATTPEEFGDVVALPSVLAAQSYASSAEVSATSATASALSATNSASSATASALSATNSATTSTIQAGVATTKAAEATADVVLTHADVLLTHADVITTTTNASTSTTNAATATTQAGIATTQAGLSTTSATNSQLRAWEAEAERMTADSYATEAEDIVVKTYTSNGNGTFTATNTAEYSSFHWSVKSALSSLGSAANISYTNTLSGMTATNVQTAIDEIDTRSDSHIPLSGATAYHLLSGSLTLGNSVVTAGMATTLYTGNGTTQSVVTGVDMATQWGNSVDETFGGLVWCKSRSGIAHHILQDTVRGATKYLTSSNTTAEETLVDTVTSFLNNGFSIGANAGINVNTSTYASWNFQTTHRITGTTNHGKAYTCHYNPFTGFTMVKYEGSGLAGHEIPHHLGRKLGFVNIKNLSVISNWISSYRDSNYMLLNLTNSEALDPAYVTLLGDISTTVGAGSNSNGSTNQHIMYGWANSYFDVQNTLIGNYEVGIYQGTGAAGNKVTTRGKPAWVMIKRLDGIGVWHVIDNQRGNYKELFPNSSAAEYTTADPAGYMVAITNSGFSLDCTHTEVNTSGGQYLYMVVYDNDSGSGKSKYPRATDTSALSLTATVPFANGVDASGTKNTVLTKNETIAGLTYTQGKNYVYAKNDGLYGVKAQAPQYGSYNGFGDYFDVNTNKWYQSPSVFSDECNTTTNWTAVSGAVLSVVDGSIKIVDGSPWLSGMTKVISTVVGKKYMFTSYNHGAWDAYPTVDGVFYTITAGVGTKLITFVASAITTTIGFNSGSGIDRADMMVDNIAIYPINNDGSVDISSATPITESRNYLDAVVYADAGGQPTYVEQLPKIEYKDIIKANEYQGKNACTAWALIDGTTTPPTILDGFNIKSVIRVSGGNYKVITLNDYDRLDYALVVSVIYDNAASQPVGAFEDFRIIPRTKNMFGISTISSAMSLTNGKFMIQILGGKN